MTSKPTPEGVQTVTAYLFVRDGARAIEFYQQVFEATELLRLPGPEGKVGHAEIKIGNSVVWFADEVPEAGFSSPLSLGGAGVNMFVYVADVDAVFNRAVAAGAKELKPVADLFYGDRVGTLVDPFGHVWSIATRKEDIVGEDLQRRAADFVKQDAG